MTDWYDKGGRPLDLMEWARLFEDHAYRRVAEDQIGEVRISTVWLGLNHRHMFPGPPLIFETMIFGGEGDGEVWRYSTLEQAIAGHRAVVEEART